MKCAECGYENKDGSRFCNYCGAPQVKLPAVSDTGSALRKIYNDFGYEKVFEDSRYITSALNDMIPDAEMVCSSIEHAYRAGLGKIYESQVRSGSRPDASFYLRVNKLITDDAGFSEKKAKQLIQIFDEMLGWETQDIPDSVSASGPVVKAETNETPVKPVEPAEPAPVIIPKPEPKPEPKPAEPAPEEPVMSEPEDEVLAALADEEYKAKQILKAKIEIVPEKPEAVTVTKSEPKPVEEVSEEEHIRSIPQEQALEELQPEENKTVDVETVKETEKILIKIEENQTEVPKNRFEHEHQAKEQVISAEKADKKVIAIVIPIIVVSIAFVIVLTIMINQSRKQNTENSKTLQESSSIIETSSAKPQTSSTKTQEGSSESTKKSNPEYRTVSLSEADVGSYVLFGSYEQDNNTSNGKENIEWIVLARNKNRILVISKYALDCQRYNKSIANVTWETCTLREWLNSSFLNTAFSAEERAMILTTKVSADKNPQFDKNPGNATKDQVFLLSVAEVNKYFNSDSARECQGTAYCYAQGANKVKYGNCWWLLRTLGYSSQYAAGVEGDGSVTNVGHNVSSTDDAIRPAIWINVGS